MFGIFKRKTNECSKGKSYNEFINSDLMPMFGMMAMVDLADDIGIDTVTLNNIMGKKIQRQSPENIDILNDMIDKVDKLVDNEEFKRKFKTKTIFIKDYGKSTVVDDMVRGTYAINNINYEYNLVVRDDYVMFNCKTKEKDLSGIFKKCENGNSLIKYIDKKVTVYNLKDRDSYHEVINTNRQNYDKNGFEVFNYTEEEHNDYYIMHENNKKTIEKKNNFNLLEDKKEVLKIIKSRKNEIVKEYNTTEVSLNDKIMEEPSPFGNYTEKSFRWRESKDTILERSIRKYSNFKEGRTPEWDNFLIGYNASPEAKTLQKGGLYTWFEKELYKDYKQGNCDLDYIWRNKDKKLEEIPEKQVKIKKK